MELYYSLSILIVIATLFAYLNKRFFGLPSSIGIMMITIIFSLILIFSKRISDIPLHDLESVIKNVDFSQMLMGCMLNFLLFAGAIRIDLKSLKEEKFMILVLASLSVIISTLVVGFALYYILVFALPILHVNQEVSLVYCLLFGALISPTDAVAALDILKGVKISEKIKARISGESLFNDGVAVVLFTLFLHMTSLGDAVDISFLSVSKMFLREVLGGVGLGLALGWLGWYGIKTANDYKITALLTLSIVMGGYIIVEFLNISGPLTMVIAGLYIGYQRGIASQKYNFKINTNVENFWDILDTILNAFLFMFMGFEILLITDLKVYWILGAICVFLVVVARYISIKLPLLVIPFKQKPKRSSVLILVWGGLRGGVSIALSLSLPPSDYREMIIAITYFVVIFSVVIQGLSIGRLANRLAHIESKQKMMP